METSNVEHHKRLEYCTTRLKYRQGRQLKAVKTYTVGNESRHLLIFGVPKINLLNELKQKLQRFGNIGDNLVNVTTKWMEQSRQLEPFVDVFHVKYEQVQEARKCKRYLDGKLFYGGILHISYAPEYETLDELRCKLRTRQSELVYRNKINKRYKKLGSVLATDSSQSKKNYYILINRKDIFFYNL